MTSAPMLYSTVHGPVTYCDEGELHVVYAAHGSESDFRRIEADLNLVGNGNRGLVLVFEDVLTVDFLRERLDPSLRSLPADVLFEPTTVRTHRERLATAYLQGVADMLRTYSAWNAAPAAVKHTIFGFSSPFNRCLLAWAAAHNVELMRQETSLEAWLVFTEWTVHRHRTDAAAARGDAETMWVENRKEWEACARANRMRDVDVNAQITRILNAERRGHDVLYVVGALHAVNEAILVGGLKATIHSPTIAERLVEQFIAALMTNTFDALPPESQMHLETLVFLHARLQTIARPTNSINDVAQLLNKILHATAAHNITLRYVIESLITIPEFQANARTVDSIRQRPYFAVMFITFLLNNGLIQRSDVEECLYQPHEMSS